MRKGTFITVEGGEGAGKTTVLNAMEHTLREQGRPVVRTREPGGVKLAEDIRGLLLDVSDIEMDDRTEALLYAAARREHLMQKVVPALEAGSIVLCDRFVDSSLAYQGHARGLGIETVRAINHFAIEQYMPDATLYFAVEPETGLARTQQDQSRVLNRLDRERLEFHQKVREGYELLARDSERIVTIDANQPIEMVMQEALGVVMHIVKK
ncbi:dTMP kinase [Shouchella shacheensis]|uniref:dTMP kinase n=1 Tax=Shouchella shacheensis TaxID=1649580 RepID=UPI00073FF73F|nr:dTMP kinase [Shouchella shacheensis]